MRFGPWARLVGLGITTLLLSGPSLGETFLVEDAANDDALQTAVSDANASADTDNTIEFSFDDAANTITLDAPLPAITPNTLTLDGTGDGLTIDGDGNTILEVRENVRVIDISLDDGNVTILADRILTLEAPTNRTSTADVDGAGGLTKVGAGTLILTGALDHTGVTTLEEGALRISNGPGGDITNEGTLEFEIAINETYDGVISGSGSLTKLGAGQLTLGGLNTYEGATIITDGTLSLVALDDGGTRRFSVTGPITVGTGSNLEFDIAAATSETFSGALDGEGTLLKNGAGTLVLGGTGASTLEINLNAGTLEGTSASIGGDVDLANGTTLVFDQGFDGTYGGSLSSPAGGTVIKRGAGNLRLNGDNLAFPGALQIEAGAVTGSVANLPNDIENGATLVFDQGSDDTFNGVVSDGAGPGSVQKTGGGRLTFAQSQTYTGATDVLAGRLDVNANLASPVNVGSAGTLGGTGSVNAPIVVDGRVAPGIAVGQLNVMQASFGAGSVLEVDIDSGGTGDLLRVTGPLTVADGAVVVPVFNNLAAPLTDLQIATSTTNGISGTFGIQDDLAFQMVSLTQNATDVDLTVAFLPVTAGVQTPNQGAVAAALQSAQADPDTNELDAAISTLLTSSLSTAQGARALDEIGPEVASQLNTAQLALGLRIGDDVQQRMRTVLSGGAAPLFGSVETERDTLYASAPTARPRAPRFGASSPIRRAKRRRPIVTRGGLRSFEPEADRLGLGGWLAGYGALGTLDGDRNAAEADYVLGGATVGFDYRLTRNVLVGVGGGFGATDLDMDDRSADGEATSVHGLAYAGYATPSFHVGLSGRYVSSELETRRRIAFATVSQTAKGDFDGESYGGRIEAGINVAGIAGVLFQPIAHFDWSRVEQDGYRESGSSAFDLHVEDESIDSQIASLGLRIHGAWALPEDLGSFQPELSARWEHQLGDDGREITASLLGDANATPIAVRGADVATDRALLNVGWIVSSYTGLRATLGYTGAFSSEQMEHGGAVSVQYTW